MSALAAIWIASLAGALLFTASGFYYGRMRAWGAMAAAEAGAVSVTASPPTMPADARRDDREMEARAELTRARAEIERLRAEVERVKAIDAGRADLEREKSTLERRAGEADALREKVDVLTQKLAVAERVASDAEKLRGAEESRRELAIEAEVLRARLHDAEYVRAENASLREASKESLQLRQRVRDLEERLAGNAPDLERTLREPHLSSVGKPGDGPSRFKEVLDRLGKHPSVSAVTVADDLGFPVETVGDHADALAALSGFMALVANKARQILPIGAVRRIVVIDDDDKTITTSRYHTEYGPLALVTLSQGPCPDWEPKARDSGTRPRVRTTESAAIEPKTATPKK